MMRCSPTSPWSNRAVWLDSIRSPWWTAIIAGSIFLFSMNSKKNAHLIFIMMENCGSKLINHTQEKLISFLNFQLRITNIIIYLESRRVRCIFPMVISSEFSIQQNRDNDHQKDAPHFTITHTVWVIADGNPVEGIEIKPRSEKLKAKIIRSAPYANQ